MTMAVEFQHFGSRQYDDASVNDIVDYTYDDAATIETVEVAPVYPLPLETPPPPPSSHEYRDLQRRNCRRNAALAITGALAVCAIVAPLSLYFKPKPTISAELAEATSPTSHPTIPPSAADTGAPTMNANYSIATSAPTSSASAFVPTNSTIQSPTYRPTYFPSSTSPSTQPSSAAISAISSASPSTPATLPPTLSQTSTPTTSPASASLGDTPSPTLIASNVAIITTADPTGSSTGNTTIAASPLEIGGNSSAATTTTAATTTSVNVATTSVSSESTPPPLTTTTTVATTTAGSTPSNGNTDDPSLSCVNIDFLTDNHPQENGFSLLSSDGTILFEQTTGSMTEPNTSYPATICNLTPGKYELVVTDGFGDGICCLDGNNGKYTVDMDGRVVLVGGRFKSNEVRHGLIVGYDSNMNEQDRAFLDAHNEKRKVWHESEGVTFRPMAWSPDLAAGAAQYVEEAVKTCTTNNAGSGPFGYNIANQILFSEDDAKPPVNAVGWWTNKWLNNPDANVYPANMQFSAVVWRSALYVGCATMVAPMEKGDADTTPRWCQMTLCRYARTPNCNVDGSTWGTVVLEDNPILCNGVVCPEAAADGTLVDGSCHN